MHPMLHLLSKQMNLYESMPQRVIGTLKGSPARILNSAGKTVSFFLSKDRLTVPKTL